MLAPIDAKVVVTIDGEDVTLRMSMRTLALAKHAGVDLLSRDEDDPALDAFEMAEVISAFAVPDHPTLTAEIAFAAMLRYGKVLGKAVATLMRDFSAAAGIAPEAEAAAEARPRKRGATAS